MATRDEIEQHLAQSLEFLNWAKGDAANGDIEISKLHAMFAQLELLVALWKRLDSCLCRSVASPAAEAADPATTSVTWFYP
jgi:hypothetical protein